MDNNPSNKSRRMAFIISGAVDAAIGAAILLLGFGLIPIDITDYGFQNWHAILFGGLMFLIGFVTLAFNLSRLEE